MIERPYEFAEKEAWSESFGERTMEKVAGLLVEERENFLYDLQNHSLTTKRSAKTIKPRGSNFYGS